MKSHPDHCPSPPDPSPSPKFTYEFEGIFRFATVPRHELMQRRGAEPRQLFPGLPIQASASAQKQSKLIEGSWQRGGGLFVGIQK